MKKQNKTFQLSDRGRELVEGNMQFAQQVAHRFRGIGRSRGISYEDILQQSYLGLCIAADRWNPEQGAAFTSLAYIWCRKSIQQLINSIDSRYTHDTDVELLGNGRTDEEDGELDASRDLAKRLMANLNPQESHVISLVYGLESNPIGLNEIAALMHLKLQRVQQIYQKALSKMETNA